MWRLKLESRPVAHSDCDSGSECGTAFRRRSGRWFSLRDSFRFFLAPLCGWQREWDLIHLGQPSWSLRLQLVWLVVHNTIESWRSSSRRTHSFNSTIVKEWTEFTEVRWQFLIRRRLLLKFWHLKNSPRWFHLHERLWKRSVLSLFIMHKSVEQRSDPGFVTRYRFLKKSRFSIL